MNAVDAVSGDALIHVACRSNDLDLLRIQLCSNPAIVNSIERVSGEALIHVACRKNKPEILLLLVAEYNADVNVMTLGDDDNISAARIAYDNRHIDCLKILADKNAQDSRELLAHVACRSNDLDLLRIQLSSDPAIINSIEPVSGEALIHVACRKNKPEILLLLVAEYNADVNVMTLGDDDNISAARIAYDNRHIDCLNILADKNAKDSREL